MRGDVRQGARRQLTRDCPEEDCDGDQTHTLYGSYPAVVSSGAWGKYMNPAYLCHGCLHVHTLLLYETPSEEPQPRFGPYPPNTAPRRHMTPREKLEDDRDG